MLSQPTIEQILEETDFEVLCGRDYLERSVSQIIVGAMEPQDAVKYIVNDSLMITPGDREDMITTTLKFKVSGIILSGGITPSQPTMDLLSKAKIAVLSAKPDTYTVATAVHDLTVKIRPQDTAKINAVIKLIKDNVDLDKISRGM
jgi:BioD-like phosphotransacetylase family protein